MHFNNKALKKLKWKEVQRSFFVNGLEPPCWATFQRWCIGKTEPSITQVTILKDMLQVDYDFFVKKT
ncbi:hypothetical protein CMO95_00550 [Candidatus Woesearchaeota archaeon]|nr:hypothetical protein [Candidatus Woesearchaeota archaeon]